jgi:hypothetical protein
VATGSGATLLARAVAEESARTAEENVSSNNGVIRIGRKGRKKFAIGDEDDARKLPVFEVDVVTAFQKWIVVDEEFRPTEEDADGNRYVPTADKEAYNLAAVALVEALGGDEYVGKVTTSEAFDLIARLREAYDDVAVFFLARSREERALPATSAVGSELRFSAEGAN